MNQNLVASYWTLAGARVPGPARWTFEARVRAASEAGFWGIGMHGDDYVVQRGRGITDEEMLRALELHGLVVDEIEFLSGWSSDDEGVRRRALAMEERLFALADAVGARQLNAGCSEAVNNAVALEVMAEHFAGVCHRAARHGLVVAIEFLPWSGIPDAATAWRVAEAAGQDNGGVLLDSWHFFRGGADFDALRAIPPQGIFGLQLNDGPAGPVGELREETRRGRRLPGEGDFDLTGLLRRLDDMGVQAPLSVEVMSDLQASLSLKVAARVAYECTHGVLDRARAV